MKKDNDFKNYCLATNNTGATVIVHTESIMALF